MKAAFVIPWYGPDIPGGAEAECRRTAENLVRRGVKVEVLTTALHSLARSWEYNHHNTGGQMMGGVMVRRFAIRTRIANRFHRYNALMQTGRPLTPDQERDYLANMVNAPGLYRHIAETKDTLFFPIPYLFSTTVRTAEIAPERCVPIACLHDEPFAAFRTIQTALTASRGVIFHTRAEYDLARRLMDFPAEKALLFGEGIDTEISGDGARFRETYGIGEPFVLYAGRRDASKNIPLLLDCFRAYAARRPDGLKLVLIGDQELEIPADLAGRVVDLGFVPVQDKLDAYTAASLLCQPSVNESFSIVIMEAWLCGTPVLVHAHCPATVEHVTISGGGLTFADEAEFINAVDRLGQAGGEAVAKARAGRDYVLDNFHWDVICERYIDLLETAGRSDRRRPQAQPRGPRVCQIVSRLRPGEPLTAEAMTIQDRLADHGLDGPIYSPDRHLEFHSRARSVDRLNSDARPGDVLIWHYADGGLALGEAADFPGPRLLRHHGLDGPLEAASADPWSGLAVKKARRRLAGARLGVDAALGATHRAVEELLRAGYQQTGLVPAVVLPDAATAPPGPGPGEPLTVLDSDPVRPDSRLEEVIPIACLLARILPGSRVVFNGPDHGFAAYRRAVEEQAARLEAPVDFVPTGAAIPAGTGPRMLISMAETGGPTGELAGASDRGMMVAAATDGPVDALLTDAALSLPRHDPARAAELLASAWSDEDLRTGLLAEQRSRITTLGQTAWDGLWAVIRDLLPGKRRAE